MNWKPGKLGKNIEVRMTLNGNRLWKEDLRCRCGNVIKIGKYADREVGHKLTQKIQNLDKRKETFKKMSKLNEDAMAAKIYMEELYKGHIKLLRDYDAEAEGAREFTEYTDVFCPKCQLSHGKLAVTVSLMEDLPEVSISKNDIIKLRAGPEMEAVASKRMGFGSVEEMRRWLDDEDMDKAKGVLEKAIAELRELALDYDTSAIISAIQNQIDGIKIETRRRKVALADAVEIIVKEQTPVIR